VYDLVLDKTSLSLVEGEEATVIIESGNGNYSLSLTSADIVTAGLSGNTIVLTAKTYGEITIEVQDQAGKTISLDVKVTLSDERTVSPRFSWDTTFELEQPNDWGVTIDTGTVSVTNVPTQRQYVLSWEGDLTVGTKTNAVLKIVKNKLMTETIVLTQLSVWEQAPGYCTILFYRGDQKGEFIFSK